MIHKANWPSLRHGEGADATETAAAAVVHVPCRTRGCNNV